MTLIERLPAAKGADVADQFDALAKAATQGEVCGAGRQVITADEDDGTIVAECDSDDDTAFIAWCFNNRTLISEALRRTTISGVGGVE